MYRKEDQMIEIIEPLVPKSYSDYLENLTVGRGSDFPWFWNENISGEEGNQDIEGVNNKDPQYGFFHILWHNEEVQSPYYKDFYPLLWFMEQKTGVSVKSMYRIRAGLSTWMNTESQHHSHVDMEYSHNVLLYYVNDSDGDTFLYNEKHIVGQDAPSKFTLKQRVTPKKGNAVLFDGLRYHSSSNPITQSKRVIVNIDFF